MQKNLRGFAVYTDDDISAFASEYFKSVKQNSRSMGRMTGILKPVADRYNKLTPDERYNFRRLSRNLIKWYGYVSQVVRMFDEDLHKEFVFLSYLLKLIPSEPAQMIDLEDKLQLEYYKLQKTFDGAITLKDETGTYTPAAANGTATPEEKTPLDEVIKKINEQYKGKFTEADKVLLSTLWTKLMNDTKLQTMVRTNDPQIFAESIFPKVFGTAAQDSYIESQDAYATLFEDMAKYNVFMHALGNIIYREMRMNL